MKGAVGSVMVHQCDKVSRSLYMLLMCEMSCLGSVSML